MGRLTQTARRLRPTVAALVLAVVGLLGALAAPAAVLAADPSFGTPVVEARFGVGIEFEQPVTLDEPVARVELLVTSADDIGPLVIEVPAPGGTGALTLRTTLSVAVDGHILPNTPVRASWRLTPADGGPPVIGPEAATVYEDERFTWRTARGDVVRVHWYEGSDAFGQRALRIGEEAVASASELLGVTEEEPVDFFIYADQEAFYDALGPGTRENVGGQANADIRTLFALISPRDIDDPWVSIVVPHELVHLVFDTAVANPYHFPPRWLNEGLATYLSQGYDAGDRATVERAADDGRLIPLDGLGGQFPTSAERFFLAYAESVSAVDYLIRTHGQDALVRLIRSYADGRTDDEAFQASIGTDAAGFGAAWLEDLDAVVPARHGPQPAPVGPVPPDWTGNGAVASPVASAGSGAGPAGSGGAGAPVPSPGQAGDADSTAVLLVVVVALLVGGGVFALAWILARRRQGDVRA